MTTEATCVDCNKVIAGFPAPGPGWAAICNVCERKRAVGAYRPPTGRWTAEMQEAAARAIELACGPEKPVGKVELKHAPLPREEKDAAQRTLSEARDRELQRLRKADADIRGAILQRRFAESGSDLPAALASMRHTFRDHSTMELVGWALRRMHSFRKDRDYWCVEHRRVRDEKEAARRDAIDWEKAAKGASIATSAMEARYTSAAGERDAYKRKFEIEQATANDLRAQLSAKTSELVEARNAADESRRACASERALRVAAEGRAALLAGPQVRMPDPALQGVISAMCTELRNALVANTLGESNELAKLEPWNLARRVSIAVGELCASLRVVAEDLKNANKRLADALTTVGNLRAERDRWRTEATRTTGKPVSVPLPSDQEHSEITRLRALHIADANALEVARAFGANWERAACNLQTERDQWKAEAERQAQATGRMEKERDAARQDGDALKLSVSDLQKLCRRVRENLESTPSSVSLDELAARTRHTLREATERLDASRSDVGRLQALLNRIQQTLDPKREAFETFSETAERVRRELDAERGAVKERDGLRSEVESLKSVVQIFADIANDYDKALKGVPAWLRARADRQLDGEPLLFSRRDELLNTARAWEEEHAPPSGSSPTGRSNPR